VVASESVNADEPVSHVCESGHAFVVRGYWRGKSPGVMDCQRPLQVVCVSCLEERLWRCNGHRHSRCKPCAARYRRRVTRIASSGLEGRGGGWAYLLTVTPPGARRHCRRGQGCEFARRHEDCEHEDACPCTPTGGADLAEWNPRQASCWNAMLTGLRRDFEGFTFFRGVEVQDGKRGGTRPGGLHLHVLVWARRPISLCAPFCRAGCGCVRARALRAGFGHSVDLAPVEVGSKKFAYYVSKYVTDSCDSRSSVPWRAEVVDTETGEVSRELVDGRYRTWSSSRAWGLTMRDIRAAAAAAMAAQIAREESDLLALLSCELGARALASANAPPG
jgi:hypothetical protein